MKELVLLVPVVIVMIGLLVAVRGADVFVVKLNKASKVVVRT